MRRSEIPSPYVRGWALLVAIVFGAIVLVPSLWYLFQIFKTVPADPGARQQ